MKYKFIIRRGKPGEKSYFQNFSIEAEDDATVLWVLEQFDKCDPLYTIEGEKMEKISWECNCRQKMCGACAMLINGKPKLACEAFLKDLGETVTIEPLSKFTLVKDLIVDKSVLHDNMMKMNLWLRDSKNNPQAAKYLDENAGRELYKSASCIQCGLCLEACPNYSGMDDFFGAALMNADYRIARQESEKKESKKQVKLAGKHFENGCSNSFACQEVCPAQIPLSLHISRLNALAWRSR